MKRVMVGTLVLLVVAGLVGAVVRMRGVSSQTNAGAPGVDGPSRDFTVPRAPEPALRMPARPDDGERFESAGLGGVVYGETTSLSASSELPAIGPRVIKTAMIGLVVERDGFADAFGEASQVAERYQGFVVDSSTEGTRARAGSLTIRVPADAFDRAVADLRALGDVERQQVSGQDVTDQFVDLQARLRSWEAQHRVLLRLVQRANSIPEILQLRNEIQQVEFHIEGLKGQLRMLRDQTSLATISVSLHEAGASVPSGDPDKPSLAQAWHLAVAGFLGVLYAVIVGLGYLVPLAVFGLAGWFVYRRLRPRPAG
jgi:hypothetical protein